MKSSRKRKVTAVFFAAAALGGVAHAAPTLNMNDLVGSNTTTESTSQGNNNIATPVVRPMATQPTPVTTQSVPQVTPLIPRVRPVPVNDIAKALSAQQQAISQPQYVVNKQNNAVIEPTLAMHSLMNVQRKTEPVTVQKQVDGKQQVQTTQVQRTPIMVQQESTTPLVIANTTQTKAVVAKQKLTIRDIQRAERERLAQLAAEESAQQVGTNQVDQQMVAQKQAEAQRQAAILAEQQHQMAMQAEQQRIAQQQAEAQRQAALKAEQERIAAEQAEVQRQAAFKAEQQRLATEQAEAQRQAALQAEQQRIAAEAAARQRAEAAAKAEAERQAALKAEQERIAAQQAEAQRQAALKAEQDRIAAQQAELARQAAIKEEQERLAAEQLAKEEVEAAAKAQAEAEAAAKAQAEAKAKAEAEANAKAEANVQESKLPQSYVNSQPIEPPLQADTSAKISLAFDVKNYESMSTTVDNKEIKYRAFEYIPYVANPIDIDQQYMNIYVPEEYFNNGTVNGYNTQTAPIFMPNAVGGYMPSQAMTPKVENGKPNSVLYALSRGYVVASPATRGRTNKASDGNFIGKAPAVIVDLQAATAYLHANDSTMPGNANRIITNGTSAGGAVSLLQGAAGNNSDFQPYLQALGAATAATNVYAVSAYAPITNLDAADMAYEWSYKGITSFNKVTMGQGELPQANVGGNTAPPQRTMQRVSLNADDVAYSNLLSEHFPEYINNLQLHDSMGRVLKLDKNGNGTFKNYVKAFIIDAANKAQAKGTDLSKHTYLVRDGKTGAIKDINWEAYNQLLQLYTIQHLIQKHMYKMLKSLL